MRAQARIILVLGLIGCTGKSPVGPTRPDVVSIASIIFKNGDCLGADIITAQQRCLDVVADADGAIALSAADVHQVTTTVYNPGKTGRIIRWTLRANWPDVTRTVANWSESPEESCCGGSSTFGRRQVFWTPAIDAQDPRMTLEVDETGADLPTPRHESIDFRIRLF